ncbi:MAG: imidazolonepropionase [Flavobacteriaceae bacterium]|nr:imidazolonepropionase [Flavobacteriaceae bacterium]MBT4112637.1 imidazolonepropionase [Flavobacteriaceae bacterium]MBT4614490.1 imidazolonepropionase [Flavobacteriaceae bacterium]MBT5246943.1 imidazolonepropionase [Flavobacteriaceae bacterium]MBT5650127.1 imidazolonepropionase [Flavobacteriaceae bacterium]
MSLLIKNIKKLIQCRTENISFVSGKDMSFLPSIDNAYLVIKNGKISDFGKMQDFKETGFNEVIDAKDRMILPSWCDSHTHIVFAGNRSKEFIDRIKGLSYEEIAARGGGILNSAKLLQNTSKEDLYNQSNMRINSVIRQGTGAIEIKSGYGLSLESEVKMLQVIKQIKDSSKIQVKSTFLGAHAYPNEFKENKDGYIDLVLNKMLPAFSKENLIDYIDVFCEKGYFSPEDTEKIIKEGLKYNIRSKIHVNQFNVLGGVKIAVENNALSVDHLEVLQDDDIKILSKGSTIPVVLPTCSYFLGIDYAPARKLIDAGLPVAIASDFNPGSSPSGNMNFVISTACTKMKLTTEESINAATINGAYAMGLEDKVGSISKGKIANLIITNKINSIDDIPYNFGGNQIHKIILEGQLIS